MILLLDTATPVCRLTIVDGDQQAVYEWQADRTLARFLLAFLRDKLAKHGAQLCDVTGIGVMRGPGSFTGLRIGLSVVITLADSLRIPIVGATGADWQQHALGRLLSGEDDRVIALEYGGQAHITRPKK